MTKFSHLGLWKSTCHWQKHYVSYALCPMVENNLRMKLATLLLKLVLAIGRCWTTSLFSGSNDLNFDDVWFQQDETTWNTHYFRQKFLVVYLSEEWHRLTTKIFLPDSTGFFSIGLFERKSLYQQASYGFGAKRKRNRIAFIWKYNRRFRWKSIT